MKFTLPIILYHINEMRNKKYLLLKNNTNIFTLQFYLLLKEKIKYDKKNNHFMKIE